MIITNKKQLREALAEAFDKKRRADVRSSLFERVQPSPEHTARMNEMLGIAPSNPIRLRYSTPRRILLIVLILIITAALVSCAYYIGVQLSARETDEYLEINGAQTPEEDKQPPTTIETFYLPTYIPDGYVKRVLTEDIYGVYIFFESQEGRIAFTQDPVGSIIRIDNEHGDQTRFTRGGTEYIKQVSSKVNYFCWTNGEYVFGIYVTHNFSDEDAFKIIDSIKPVENQ